jgi:hypothetical protein
MAKTTATTPIWTRGSAQENGNVIWSVKVVLQIWVWDMINLVKTRAFAMVIITDFTVNLAITSTSPKYVTEITIVRMGKMS